MNPSDIIEDEETLEQERHEAVNAVLSALVSVIRAAGAAKRVAADDEEGGVMRRLLILLLYINMWNFMIKGKRLLSP